MKNISQQEKVQSSSAFLSAYVYNELSDTPVTQLSLEEEFMSRLALVEDLHNRFRFMIGELKTSGLRVED